MASRKKQPANKQISGVQPPAETGQPAAPESQGAKWQSLIFPAMLILMTLVAYAKVTSCGFIEAYDDEEFVTLNAVVLKGLSWYGLQWSLSSFMTGNWYPLTWWSHMADVALFGRNPAGHHAVNLALHLLNTLLLYAFFSRTTRAGGKSFVIAALFALHPLHVESVAWIAERKDLLSTAFGLLALHCYAIYSCSSRLASYLAMFLFFCLSLMAKPMLVTFPFLLLILDYWPLGRLRNQSFRQLAWEKFPLLLPVIAISVVTVIAQKSVGALVARTLPARLSTVLDSYLVYLRKFFAPYDLASYYPYIPVSTLRVITAAVLLAIISLGAWHYRHRCPWLLAGWLWYLGLLIPVIGFVSVGVQAYADRYTYLPIVGICVIVIWSAAELFRRLPGQPWPAACTATVLIIACAVATWIQVGYWQDGFSLYARELAVVPGNWHAQMNLGTMMVERKRFDEGIDYYQSALLNDPPSQGNIHYNIGVVYERKGDTVMATQYFRSTTELAPGRDSGYRGLARILGRTGDLTGALNAIRQGLDKVPDNWLLLAKEAYLLHKLGNTTAAINSYRQAIAKEPSLAQNYINLGILLKEQGRTAELRPIIKQLRRIDPKAADELASTASTK